MSSDSALLECGVPQRLVLGPDRFAGYSSPNIWSSQILWYLSTLLCWWHAIVWPFMLGETESIVLGKLQKCVSNLRTWMNAQILKLNDNKTEFIIFCSAHKWKKVKTTTIFIGEEHITASSSVRNIHTYMGKQLKMDVHMVNTCKFAKHTM